MNNKNKIKNQENKAQNHVSEPQNNDSRSGIYLRDDHCDWGSSGMEDISTEDSNQSKNS